MHGGLRRQQGAQHFLRRGLADAAGDRGEAAGEAVARERGQPAQPVQGIAHQQQLRIRRQPARHPMRHRARRALGQRIGNVIVAVAAVADQRDEQIAGLERARIDRHAGRRERRGQLAAGRGGQFFGIPERRHGAPARRRTTATSSNGSTVDPTIWPCS